MTQDLNIQNGGPVKNTHQNEAHIIIEGGNRNAYITSLFLQNEWNKQLTQLIAL